MGITSKKFRKMKQVIINILILSMLVTLFNLSGTETRAYAKTKAMEYVDAMEPGWNLGNSFDAIGGETAWGNPIVSEELILAVKEQGYNSIRIPITWDGHFNKDDENYTIDENYFKRLDTVINQALNAGFYVMINMHHDSWSWVNKMDSDETVLPKFEALWTQIANHYKDYSDKLMFESMNEPIFDDVQETQMFELLNQLNQSFYDIVRTSGGNNKTRMLVLPTVYTNDSVERCKALYDMMIGLNDGNLIATIHYYGFWPFSVNIAGKTTFDEEVKRELENAFDRVYNQFIANGIPVICGEYGLLGFDNNLGTVEHGEILKYFEYIGYYAKKNDVLLMLWDNGQHFNRNKFIWSDPELYEIMKSSWNGRSSYTTSDRLFIKEEYLNKDQELKLILNGNSLEGIYNGTNEMVLGTDYTYENEIVTLNGTYMNQLIKDSGNTYGVIGILRFDFSGGADWNLYVTYYDNPELTPAKGNTSTLSIPTDFKGTRLSTMEAIYTDGSGNAGPQNWTSYKQFSETFSPDYINNSITVNSKFFAETKNGEIQLKFHFQSGEVIEYTVVKADNEVKEITYTDETIVTPTLTEIPTEDRSVTENNTMDDLIETEKISENTTLDENNNSKNFGFKQTVIAIIICLGIILSVGVIYWVKNKK
jgi:aryl-phospho-beta-D-glucosidase BglC (GH1 family)